MAAPGLPVASAGGNAYSVSIANGASLSGALNLGTYRLAGIVIPAAFDGTSLTFQVSLDNETYVNLYKEDGTEYTLTVSTSRGVAVDLSVFAGWPYIKIRSGTSGAASVQSAARTVGVATIA